MKTRPADNQSDQSILSKNTKTNFNRRSWRSECLFSPTHTALLISVKRESKLNEDLKKKIIIIVKWVIWGFLFFWGGRGGFWHFNLKQNKTSTTSAVSPPDFRRDGISVRLSPRLELLKCSVSCLFFFRNWSISQSELMQETVCWCCNCELDQGKVLEGEKKKTQWNMQGQREEATAPS